MNLPKWSVDNRVAVNLLAIVLLVSGYLAATTRLKLDLFPDVSTNFIQVTTLDPTTSIAEEIERTITVPIEEELASVSGVKRIDSISEDNFSNIFIEIESSVTNLDPVLNEVRQAVDKAKAKLPATIEPPVIEEFDLPYPLITFAVSIPAGTDLLALRPALERIERRLRIIPGVSEVLTDGLDRREVWVEVDPVQLEAAGVSIEEVTASVSNKNRNAVGGRIDGEGGQRLVRLVGEIEDPEQLANVPVKSHDGRTLLLRDIATFVNTTEEPRTFGRTNMQRSVTFTVIRKKGADAIQTVEKCREVFKEEAANLPDGFRSNALGDTTKFIRVRLNTVAQNGFQALILVTVLLIFVLNWRLALLVAIGIPISFAGALLVLYFGGYTLNMLSLFGMIMALGMVVDDAIVMAENCYRRLQQGESPTHAAIHGAQEVLWPVVGSVSTTVAAFLPLIWAEGIIGKFLMIVPVVVISALIFSLIQAFVVLPSHFADFVRPARTATQMSALPPARGWSRLARAIEQTYVDMRGAVDSTLAVIIELYRHLLTMALRCRYLVILGFIAILVAAGALLASGIVPFKIFSTDFADTIYVKCELPADYSLQQTEDAVARLEARIADVLPQSDLLALITRIGARFDATNQFLEYGTNLGLITVDIDEENPLCRKPSEIARSLRTILSEFPEFVKITVQVREGGPPVGRPVNIELSGPDFPELVDVAGQVEDRLDEIPGVYNVGNDFPRGKTEYRITVDEPRAAELGLDSTRVGRAVQAAFFGLEADRMRWGNEEVILRVKFAERASQDPEHLKGLRITNAQGRTVDLSSVAHVEPTTGLARIKRANQERVITISADVESRIVTSAEVNAQIGEWLPGILANHPTVQPALTGENEDTQRSIASMQFAALVAMLLIYTLLAVITNSFLQPVVIMSVIPFGLVGVVLGLMVMGQPIGLMSIMGTVALAGIVVNNSVVFVDFINQYRHRATGESGPSRHQPFHLPGITRWRSILRSAATRLRPVLLTTATTVVGLANLAFFSTGQEQFLAPMAQAIIFGLTFATMITLVLIPCLYSVLDDLHQLFRKRTAG